MCAHMYEFWYIIIALCLYISIYPSIHPFIHLSIYLSNSSILIMWQTPLFSLHHSRSVRRGGTRVPGTPPWTNAWCRWRMSRNCWARPMRCSQDVPKNGWISVAEMGWVLHSFTIKLRYLDLYMFVFTTCYITYYLVEVATHRIVSCTICLITSQAVSRMI